MNKIQRREVYWRLYVVAEGMKVLGCRIRKLGAFNFLIYGLCMLFEDAGFDNLDEFPELIALKPKRGSHYWWKECNWIPRADALLKAYESTF